jgi:hypothetical protein
MKDITDAENRVNNLTNHLKEIERLKKDYEERVRIAQEQEEEAKKNDWLGNFIHIAVVVGAFVIGAALTGGLGLPVLMGETYLLGGTITALVANDISKNAQDALQQAYDDADKARKNNIGNISYDDEISSTNKLIDANNTYLSIQKPIFQTNFGTPIEKQTIATKMAFDDYNDTQTTLTASYYDAANKNTNLQSTFSVQLNILTGLISHTTSFFINYLSLIETCITVYNTDTIMKSVNGGMSTFTLKTEQDYSAIDGNIVISTEELLDLLIDISSNEIHSNLCCKYFIDISNALKLQNNK